MLTFKDVKNNPYVIEFIKESDRSIKALGYTEHSFRHLKIVSDRARMIARMIGLTPRQQELTAMASYCHDMGNFLSRTNHHYFAGILFMNLFRADLPPDELAIVMQSIMNHDKEEMKFSQPISAIVVLADKSDVHRSRVNSKDKKAIESDIHQRVNYSATDSKLSVRPNEKKIILRIKIDVNYIDIMEFFEIFIQRMVYCRKAAQFLGYDFDLMINNIKLL